MEYDIAINVQMPLHLQHVDYYVQINNK